VARGRDRRAGDDPRELEVLDPITGEAVPLDRPPVDHGLPRGRGWRRRRLALGLALASVACAAAAVWFGAVAWSLRATEHVWAEAMALDGAREAADRALYEKLDAVGNPSDDPATRDGIDAIGRETSARLAPLEERLRGLRIADDRISALRDLMLEALRFRRFQLAADRRLLGDTPLRRVEAELDVQLDRFGLDRSTPPTPVLRSVEPALAALGRFADDPTGTLLVTWTGSEPSLLYVDVDASTLSRRPLPRPPQHLFAADDLVLVDDGRTITAYPLDPEGPPAWSRPRRLGPPDRRDGVTGRPGSGIAWWAWEPAGIVPVDTTGAAGAPVPVGPPGPADGSRELLADTDPGLLIGEPGRLLVVDRETGAVVRSIIADGRFAGATRGFAAIQLPGRPVLDIHRLADGTSTDLPLPRTDAGMIVQAPDGETFAFAAGPLAGNIASVLRLEVLPRGWQLIGIDGPRATVRPGTVTWSPTGDHLFWVTPEGQLAIAADGAARAAQLRTPIDGAQELVAFPGRR
jgi:hypothetical protein